MRKSFTFFEITNKSNEIFNTFAVRAIHRKMS